VIRARKRDHHDACECDRAAREERLWKAFVEEQPREHRDQHRSHGDEHRRRAGIDVALAGVQCDVVRAEPEQPAGEERGPGRAQGCSVRQSLAAKHAERRERDQGDEQAAERERARGEASPRGADADERRRPEEHGHTGGGESGHVGASGALGGGGGRGHINV
jgi:hypothetical protein